MNQVLSFNVVSQPQLQQLVTTNGNPAIIAYDQVGGYFIPYQQQMIQWVAIPQPQYPQMQSVEYVNPQIYSHEQVIQNPPQVKIYSQYVDNQNQWQNQSKPKIVRPPEVRKVVHGQITKSQQQPIEQPTQQLPHPPEQAIQREFTPALFGADKNPPKCFDIIGRGNLPSINFSTVYSSK
ncbi:hypothetical protein GPJ56_000614 [Histomonas meleagridis]|uniref:uncharacterized protein n=1 Tax=Histomonas meleagridis TaxID=135588 RepID=UPI0035596C63|nr:hypothetical protein GPJ56_000614 [Histomonas meleagridis]KAH0804741.1 hypothetical protein GO595_002435 [Histomonas meleagridis]